MLVQPQSPSKRQKTSQSIPADPTATRVSKEECFTAGHGEEKAKRSEMPNIPMGAAAGRRIWQLLTVAAPFIPHCQPQAPTAGPSLHPPQVLLHPPSPRHLWQDHPCTHHRSCCTHHHLPTLSTEQRIMACKMQMSVDIMVMNEEQELINILLKISFLDTTTPNETVEANHQAMNAAAPPPPLPLPCPKHPIGLPSWLPRWLSLLTSMLLAQEVAG